MVMRTYVVTRAYNVRRYERWEVRCEEGLGEVQERLTAPKFDEFVIAHGEELSSDHGEVDDDLLEVWIDEEIVEEEPDLRALPVPLPPTTIGQAEAWVRWAETEIGLGWHPDTWGADLVTHPAVGIEAHCQCGETFNPASITDTIHLTRADGTDCLKHGVITGTWHGSPVPLLPDPEVCARYDAGLKAAHDLLPDIYATAMTIFRELHPDLTATPRGV